MEIESKAENLLDKQEDQEAHKIEAKDTKTLGQLARADLESKTIVPQIVKVKGESAKIVTIGEVRLGNQFTDFDLLDFNAACPVKKVTRRGEGAGLLKDPKKLRKLLKIIVENSDTGIHNCY